MTAGQVNWLLLSNAALGNFLAGTSSRIFSVSLPTVANSLETTIVGISWAVIAYQISQISLSLIFGRIGDIYGRHTLFGLGLIVSSLAALACGLSQSAAPIDSLSCIPRRGRVDDAVPGARARARSVAQGVVGTSARIYDDGVSHRRVDWTEYRRLDYRIYSLARDFFFSDPHRHVRDGADAGQPHQRQRAATGVDGPTGSDRLSRRAVVDRRYHRFDREPSITASWSRSRRCCAWLSSRLPSRFPALSIGSKPPPSPILDLSLFRIRMFTLSSLALLLVGIAQVMIGFVLPFYLQDVLHLKPSFIGLLFVSAPIFTVTLSPLVGWAVDKVGPRLPATDGHFISRRRRFFGLLFAHRLALVGGGGRVGLWGWPLRYFLPPTIRR